MSRESKHERFLRRRLAAHLGEVADRRKDRPRRHRAARAAAHAAEHLGLLIRPPECECCGDDEPKLQRHHWDYAQPLCVTFLCPDCHELADAMLKTHGAS